MTWTAALFALVGAFTLAVFASLPGRRDAITGAGVLSSYLLSGGALGRVPVISLLVSTSFGVNTMLYQGYLGATVGLWGLVVQAAWAAGFFMLLPYVAVVKNQSGLHGFLGRHYGPSTRVVAALASLTGLLVFLGWETSIGRDALKGMLLVANPQINAPAAAEWLVGGMVVGCLMYTVLGGMRGNATANIIQNILKLVGFGVVAALLIRMFYSRPGASLMAAMFPPLAVFEASLGWIGLFTSVFFGLAWQFVDMSTWQSLAASSLTPSRDVKWNLSVSGFLVFVTPGVLGTFFGLFLSGAAGAAENVLVAASALALSDHPLLTVLYAAAIMTAVMSLIDGLFLASTYAVIVDLLHPDKSIEQLDQDAKAAGRSLLQARIVVIVVAVLAIWGIPRAIKLLDRGADLFFFSFVVVVAQLSLIGPVVVALLTSQHAASTGSEVMNPSVNQRLDSGRREEHASLLRPTDNTGMWLAIVLAFAAGLWASLYGATHKVRGLIDGAGTITIAVSLAAAYSIAWLHRHRGAKGRQH